MHETADLTKLNAGVLDLLLFESLQRLDLPAEQRLLLGRQTLDADAVEPVLADQSAEENHLFDLDQVRFQQVLLIKPVNLRLGERTSYGLANVEGE